MKPGRVVDERFEIEAMAGRGGMGVVYRAFDRASGSRVALKVLKSDEEGSTERFAREARLLAAIRDPGIVGYVGHGTTEDGEPYLAMDWLDGHDLASVLRRGPVAIADGLGVARRTALALGAAHAQGVVHRDVKPSNVFLVGGALDQVRLLDFGLARDLDARSHRTRTGTIMGTIGFMAPEQVRGVRKLDPSADVFALGCVLFRCLTGRDAFHGPAPVAVLAKIVFEEPPRASELRPGVPAPVDALVAHLLEKAPKDRPRDGAEAALLLEKELAALSAGPIPGAPEPYAITAGEQRLLSVVLSGPGAPLDVEEARAAAVSRGGRFERLSDGSLVLSFAGQSPTAEAAACALALRALYPDLPLSIATGRGQALGPVPVGEAIDRAAASLGDLPVIRLDDVTAGLLDARFLVEEGRGGRRELQGEREAVDRAPTLLGKPTPFVGREAELAALAHALSTASQRRRARAVVITGPAGIGKSRLRAALTARLGFPTWVGRADPMTGRASYAILAQALRRAAGILEGEPPGVRREKLRARVGRRVAAAEAMHVAEFLGEVVGVPFPEGQNPLLASARETPAVMAQLARRAFEDFLRAETEEPLLVVLEDLHAADAPSVRLVGAALRALHDRPFLIVALGRPELFTRFPDLWAEHDPAHIALGELSSEASSRLVRHALGDDEPPATVARLVARGEGNPFYLEEMVRAVAAGQRDELPGTVLALAQARLEARSPEERRVLRAASVFGEVFWRDGVLSLLGRGDQPGLDEALASLVKAEILAARDDGAIDADDEYAFRHALLREAAYRSLTEADRALAHRLAAGWLHGLGERGALELAEHFDRGGEPEHAVAWYRLAARQALEAGDPEAAIARADRGVSCGASGETLGSLRALSAEARWWRGDFPGAARDGHSALESLPSGHPDWCSTIGALCEVSCRRGRGAELDRLVEALRAAATRGPGPAPAVVLATLSRAAVPLLIAGLYGAADALFLALDEAERAPGSPEEAAGDPLLAHAFWHFFRSGDIDKGFVALRAAAAAFAREKEPLAHRRALVLIDAVRVQQGDHRAAEPSLRAAIDAADRAGLPYVAVAAQSYLACGLGRATRDPEALGEAVLLARRAVRACSARDDRLMGVPARCHLAMALAASADLEGAEAAAREARALSVELPRLGARASATLAHVLLERGGRAQEALAVAGEAAAILASLEWIGEGDGLVGLSYGRALEAVGRSDEAQVAFRRARDRLSLVAGRVADPEMRRQYLEDVPENAALFQR